MAACVLTAAMGLVAAVGLSGSCASGPSSIPAARSVTDEWNAAAKPADASLSAGAAVSIGEETSTPQAAPVAVMEGGGGVKREPFVDLLIRFHGPALLEELAVTTCAQQELERRGLAVRDEDVELEYQTLLADMTNPLHAVTGAAPDRREAQRVLEAVLAERNIPLAQFRLGVRRQAMLRKLIERETTVSDEEVERDLRARRGERVQVRHIQVATPAQAETVLRELRGGAAFADVAGKFSGNAATAARGGLLEPFSRDDERVPAILREAAFNLPAGEVSAPLRVGHWYHVLTLEGRLPALEAPDAATLEDVRRRLTRMKQDEALPRLYRRMLEEANIVVLDPALKDAYDAWRLRPAG
ncbi:MAG: peptidyl-prolyl cis-trans isomerase [Phycisphaerales bacterium]|nr:peptidyl-prolyl cis-trans isomerase [Phycisphaerales bacterium]